MNRKKKSGLAYLHPIMAAQQFALTSGGRGLCFGAEKTRSQISLQMRPVHIKFLLKFQCHIWGHHTRSVASGRVSEGRWGEGTLCLARYWLMTILFEAYLINRCKDINENDNSGTISKFTKTENIITIVVSLGLGIAMRR